MQRIQGDVLRGHLEGMVLAALSRGEAHGFEVLRRLEELGCGALSLKEGTLYPVLYRLEEAGLVKAAWEDDSSDRRGPRRRIYRLNEKGASDLARRRAGLGAIRNDRGGDIGGTRMSTSVFKDHIERAVGPVRAVESRKDRMGEELSAHLAASFEEERTRLGDDQAAAERAIQRLGKVSELTPSLQDSVPRLERFLYIPLPAPRFFDTWERAWARRSDEALSRYAARITACLTAFGTVGDS